MTNCEHDAAGICKSCRQTQQEGGNVALHEEAKAPEVKVEPGRSDPAKGRSRGR
ncbi:hypothetical protein LCGC14_0445090 [marine sediment metagenome]|uniref:Uncharacterized protein n=1 Tax=marine sediment metagenome TaxID=412755 RepID=A0A0F9T2H7_9ZZZZ